MGAMGKRGASRRAAYPVRFVGIALEDAVRAKVEENSKLSSQAAVAKWLGYDRARFNNWVRGYSHPRSDEDWRRLSKLLGIPRKRLRHLELLDKLDGWRRDEDLTPSELAVAADEVAQVLGR